MKHSSTWYALMLIASAFLLNGVRSVNADSPSPSPIPTPNHSIQASEQPKLPEQPAAQYVAPSTVTSRVAQQMHQPPAANVPNSGDNSILAIGTFFFICLDGRR